MQDDNLILDQLVSAKRQLRLAIITETYPPEINGVAMTTGRMVSALQQQGHWIELVRPKQHSGDIGCDNDALEEVLQRGIPIPRYSGLKFGLPAKRKLMARWKLRRPDLVHVVTEGPLGWSAIAAARVLKIPVTSDFHTNFHTYSQHYGLGWLQKPVNAYLRKFHNQTLTTFVPTRELVNDLQQCGYRNLKVVARGVDTHLFSPQKRDPALRQAWGLSDKDTAVIYVGRLAAEKNLSLVFDAFEAMHKERNDLRLILVGDGPQRSEWQQRHPEHVFAGMRVGEDLARHYASGDVFLFPSLSETFGNVTLEAMASGLAVIAYDYAAAREHIQHQENGILVKAGDAGSFCQAAAELAVMPEQIGTLRSAAAQTAAHIGWLQVFSEFEQQLFEVIKNWEQSHD
ncbi:MAG: glycosyltransferase family 4 protein [Burkholderiales bacterium]|jgi:glycosyltransferase involved in cell wall biosynthesis